MRLRSRTARALQAPSRRIFSRLRGGLFVLAVSAHAADLPPAPASPPDDAPPIFLLPTGLPTDPPAQPKLNLAPSGSGPDLPLAPFTLPAPTNPAPALMLPEFSPVPAEPSRPAAPPPDFVFQLPAFPAPAAAVPAFIPTITFPAGFNLLEPPSPARTFSANSLQENEYYEVVGSDSESISTVLGLTKQLQAILARDLPWPDQAVQRIEVQLVPDAQADFAGPFVVVAPDDGNRIVRLRWDADTKFPDVCLALGIATLERLANWQGGAAAGAQVPDWMKMAFAKQLEVSVKPALNDLLAEQAHNLPALTLRQIMSAKGPYDDPALAALTVNAYWLAAFLAQETNHGESTRALFNALLAGGDAAGALRDAFPDRFASPAELESWWDVGYLDLATRHAALVQSMAQTRAVLDRFQQILVPASGHDQYLRLDEAWAAPARATKAMRDRIAAQLLQAAREYPPPYLTINPVFSNAFKSLMVALHDLYGDDEKTFRADWLRYQTDRKDAELIEQTVNAAMAGTS